VHDGVDGVLVDPFDTPAFADALEELLADDDRRRSVAGAGAARVVDFAWPAIAERYRAVYTSVLPVEATTGGSDGVAVELSRPPQGESVS
jgi:glycosyltransferase involved in cell wall biosynthesis